MFIVIDISTPKMEREKKRGPSKEAPSLPSAEASKRNPNQRRKNGISKPEQPLDFQTAIVS